MKTSVLLVSMLLLGGCMYAETPYGRMAVLDLPVEQQTTVNKTITVNAPPGTTVIYNDTQPVVRERRYPHRPYYYYP